MSDGIDGNNGENEVDSHSSSVMNVDNGEVGSNRDDEQLDGDNEAQLNTNYDSSDGAVPVFR